MRRLVCQTSDYIYYRKEGNILSYLQICGSFSAHAGIQGHIKLHHAHTNVIGLGDSSVWKVPSLPRTVYLFLAPLFVPIITPLVALGTVRP